MLQFIRAIHISIIVWLVFVVANISTEPLRKDNNNSGKTLVQGALQQLLAKQTKSDHEHETHVDRTKPSSLLHTSILGGGSGGGGGGGGPPPGYFTGYPGYGPGGAGSYGYGNNFAAGFQQGGYPPFTDYGPTPYWQSAYCQQCCCHNGYYPYKKGQGLESQESHTAPLVHYKVKESVEVLERFSRANNDGSQEHKVVLSNGLTIFQKIYNKSNEKQQLQPIEGYYSQKLSDNSYLTTYHRSSEKGYFATSEVSSTPPDGMEVKEPKALQQ